MAVKDYFKNVTLTNVIVAVVSMLVIIQVLAMFIRQFYPELAFSQVKLGTSFLLLLIPIGFYFLVSLVQLDFKLDRKQFLLMLITVGLLIGIYYYLPKTLPNIFSAVDLQNSLKSILP